MDEQIVTLKDGTTMTASAYIALRKAGQLPSSKGNGKNAKFKKEQFNSEHCRLDGVECEFSVDNGIISTAPKPKTHFKKVRDVAVTEAEEVVDKVFAGATPSVKPVYPSQEGLGLKPTLYFKTENGVLSTALVALFIGAGLVDLPNGKTAKDFEEAEKALR
jgi:hypothetical protein